MKNDLSDIVAILDRFTGKDLTETLARIEKDARRVTEEGCGALLERAGATRKTLAAAAELKRMAGQVHVTIHALGILRCLPHILETGEKIESISLGAGNTGQPFDLETNLRVAEFKFIHWRGGPESIRQNATFKDFYLLAVHPTPKRKHLYLLGTQHAVKFLRGDRSLKSVLSTDQKVRSMFFDQFGERFRTVGEYYAVHKREVEIGDVSAWVGELMSV